MGGGYYQVEQDFPPAGRWYLGDVCDDNDRPIDTSVLLRATPLDLKSPVRLPLIGGGTTELAGLARIKVSRPGPATPFTLGAFDLPVVSRRLAELLHPLVGGDVQRLPCRVDGQEETFEVLNIVACPDCIDYDRSQVEWWAPPGSSAGGSREPFAVYELALTPAATGGHAIFRPAGWTSAVIVSATVKAVVEGAGGCGIRFTAV